MSLVIFLIIYSNSFSINYYSTVDSGAFISGTKLDKFGPDTIYYISERVRLEIKDTVAKKNLENFPYPLKTRVVSEDAFTAGYTFSFFNFSNVI